MKKNKLLMSLPIRTVLFILIFLITSLVTKKSVEEISVYWTIVVIVCNFITIFTLYRICEKRDLSYLQLIGYKESKKKSILFVGIAVTLIGIAGAYLSGLLFYKTIPYTPDVMIKKLPIIIVIIDLFLLPITSTIAEEGLYMGVGINLLNMMYLTIFFYLLQHCFFPLIIDVKYMIYRFVSFIPVIVFMCSYYKKKKEIVPIMFGHFLINFITIIQYLLV